MTEIEAPTIEGVILWVSKHVVRNKFDEGGAKLGLIWIVISNRCQHEGKSMLITLGGMAAKLVE